MYNAEVLSKFPVVQHFPFGSLFSWEQDPNALPAENSVHTTSQPNTATSRPQEGTKAPWANQSSGSGMGSTAAPWAATSKSTPSGVPPTTVPWATSSGRMVPPHDIPGKNLRDIRDNRG